MFINNVTLTRRAFSMTTSIMSSINILSEADFKASFKRGWDAFKAARADRSEEQEPEPERVKPDAMDDENALVTIGTELLQTVRDEVRVVLYLGHLELKSYYLVKGGGGKLIDTLEDSEIDKIKHGGEIDIFKLAILGNNFTYVKMLNSPKGMDRAVLINAPKALVSQLLATSTADEAKPLLKKLLSHNLYVMTLDLSRAKHPDVLKAMKPGTPVLERAALLNPHMLENYPNYTRYESALREYARAQHAQSPDAQEEERIARLERKAELAAREKSAESTMQGTKSNTQYVIDVFAGATSVEKAATSLLGAVASKRMSRIELERILRVMSTDTPLFKAKEVLELIQQS